MAYILFDLDQISTIIISIPCMLCITWTTWITIIIYQGLSGNSFRYWETKRQGKFLNFLLYHRIVPFICRPIYCLLLLFYFGFLCFFIVWLITLVECHCIKQINTTSNLVICEIISKWKWIILDISAVNVFIFSCSLGNAYPVWHNVFPISAPLWTRSRWHKVGHGLYYTVRRIIISNQAPKMDVYARLCVCTECVSGIGKIIKQ